MPRILFLLAVLAATSHAAFVPAKRPYDALHYKIRLEIDPAKAGNEFAAQTQIRFRATAALEKIVLDIEDLKIEKVTQLKPVRKTLAFQVKDAKALEVTFPEKVGKGTERALLVEYTGKIHSSHNGLFKVTDPDEPERGPLLFTQLEPTASRSLYPCNDEPYDKATVETETTVPAKYDVVSNGRPISDKKTKRAGQPWHTVTWRLEKPTPSYLVALAIAPFAKVSAVQKGKEIGVYVGKTKTAKAQYVLGSLKETMSYLESYLGVPYPWPRYGLVGIPTFLWGGMENTSVSFQNQERSLLNDPNSEFEKRRITSLAAHELAHQWFGDYVTLAWWDDVWLNESFASLMDTLVEKQQFKSDESEIDFVTDTWDSYFRQEDGPRSHPIVEKEMKGAEDAFDSINYTKGENVLRMLTFYLGEEKFRKGLTLYLTSHGYANATNRDFFAAMEKASGEELQAFRDSWILQRGYPVVSYSGKWDEKTSSYTLKIAQKPNHAEDKTVFRFRLPVAFQRKATPAYTKAATVDLGKGGLSSVDLIVSLPAEPEWVTVNPGGVALAKVQQTDRDETILAAQALGDPDSIARVWAAHTLAENLKDGKSISSQAEKTLAEMLHSDASPYVRNAILSLFQKAKVSRLPTRLGDSVFDLAKSVAQKDYETSPLTLSDKHGWREFRAEVLGTLGKVDRKETLPFLAEALGRRDLPLDDLGKAALAVAQLGDERSANVLKEALKLHKDRGYRYEYVVLYSFGAYESPKAAAEIREIAKTAGSDLMGRWGWIIRDNHSLRESNEWASFLRDFVLTNDRFGDEVKSRLLETVEEVRTDAVKATMEAIARESKSERLREIAKKVLDKNFASTAKS